MQYRDTLAMFANRQLLVHLITRHGLGSMHGKTSDEMLATLHLRDALLEEFTGYIREGDELATPREYLRRWVAGVKAIGTLHDDAITRYRQAAKDPEARAPFPPAMIGWERGEI